MQIYAGKESFFFLPRSKKLMIIIVILKLYLKKGTTKCPILSVTIIRITNQLLLIDDDDDDDSDGDDDDDEGRQRNGSGSKLSVLNKQTKTIDQEMSGRYDYMIR